MDSVFGILRFDGRPIAASELACLAGDPPEPWVGGAGADTRRPTVLRPAPDVALGFIPGKFSAPGLALESLHDPASGLVVVAEARLTNRAEVSRALSRATAEPHRQFGDAELILQAWLRWRAGSMEHLQGAFAFTIWDPAARQFYCARDRLGVSVLGYATTNRFFAFASDSEWLARLPELSGRPNPTAVAEWLDTRYPMLGSRSTWRDEVEAVLPGELVTVGADRTLSRRRWWSWRELLSHPSERAPSSDDFRGHFERAVRQCVDEPGQSGVMLSGGLDSLAVACAFQSCFAPEQRLRTYSCVSDGADDGDIESRSICAVIEDLDAVACKVGEPSLTGTLSAEDLIRLAWDRPHPVEIDLLIPSICTLAAAREQRSVLLHGVCGDIVTSAATFYMADSMRRMHWLRAIRECVLASRNHVYLRHHGAAGIFLRSLSSAFLPGVMRTAVRKLTRPSSQGKEEAGLLSNELIAEYRVRLQQDREEAGSGNGEAWPLHANFDYLEAGLAGFGRVGRRFGVAMRDPWADLDIIRYFARLPTHEKVRGGWTKYPVRMACNGRVRPEVVWRCDKQHLGPRFTRLLARISESFIRETLHSRMDSVATFVNLDRARKVAAQFDPDGPLENLQQGIALTALIQWHSRSMPVSGYERRGDGYENDG